MEKGKNMAVVDIEILISEVMKHPALWNDRHKDFKNMNVKTKLWKEIADMFGTDCKCIFM